MSHFGIAIDVKPFQLITLRGPVDVTLVPKTRIGARSALLPFVRVSGRVTTVESYQPVLGAV